jgi:hypothetical protein
MRGQTPVEPRAKMMEASFRTRVQEKAVCSDG